MYALYTHKTLDLLLKTSPTPGRSQFSLRHRPKPLLPPCTGRGRERRDSRSSAPGRPPPTVSVQGVRGPPLEGCQLLSHH